MGLEKNDRIKEREPEDRESYPTLFSRTSWCLFPSRHQEKQIIQNPEPTALKYRLCNTKACLGDWIQGQLRHLSRVVFEEHDI